MQLVLPSLRTEIKMNQNARIKQRRLHKQQERYKRQLFREALHNPIISLLTYATLSGFFILPTIISIYKGTPVLDSILTWIPCSAIEILIFTLFLIAANNPKRHPALA